MWRKSNEARPNPAASKTPAPAGTAETPKQTQAVPQQSSTTSPQANGSSTAANAAKTPAAIPTATNATSANTTSAATTPAPATSVPAPVKSAPVPPVTQAQAAAPTPVRTEEASTISAGLKIKGDITGTSDLTIDGEAQGKVRLTNGRVTVGPKGRVIADIDAREIVVNGTVQGNLKASDSVRLGPSGHVEGSILTARIGIDDGARLRGNVEMIRAGETPESNKRGQDNAQTVRAATASASQDSD
jgi:cytoskeletal protein CcmA (bactofilin family)